MVSDVKAFCETCHTCKISKPNNQKPYGLLNPLEVPSYPWESIGMDFVGPLPESGNRDGMFDSITVVICLLTLMVHLIPSRTNYSASQLAELMFEHIYTLHGLPKNIISDRASVLCSLSSFRHSLIPSFCPSILHIDLYFIQKDSFFPYLFCISINLSLNKCDHQLGYDFLVPRFHTLLLTCLLIYMNSIAYLIISNVIHAFLRSWLMFYRSWRSPLQNLPTQYVFLSCLG